MLIRPATPDDAHRIAEIHVRSWQVAYEGVMPTSVLDGLSVEKGEVSWRERLTEGKHTVLVSTEGDLVTGWLVFGRSRDDDATETDREIFGIYVDPPSWRRGARRALVSHALRLLEQQGTRLVTLWVLEANPRARAFYETMGFELDPTATKSIEREGTVLPELRYQRCVGPGWSIRPAHPEDAAAIGTVHARSQHATYVDVMPAKALAEITVEERTHWWTRALDLHGSEWVDLVVQSDGGVTGFASAGPAGLGHGSTLADYELYFLYLLPEWERRRIGTALMARTFAELRRRGAATLQVLCLRDTPATRFYERMGGTIVEEGAHSVTGGSMIPHLLYRFELCNPTSDFL